MPWPETDVLEPGAEPHDAIGLLRADMGELDGAFARFWDASHDDDRDNRRAKVEAARDVCQRTRAHLELESDFLRAVAGAVADAALLRQMRAGQDKALELCAQIERADPEDRQYDVAVRVLGDFLLQRAAGESEGVFRQVVASRLNLVALATQLRAMHAQSSLAAERSAAR
jgi:hypothetical protein